MDASRRGASGRLWDHHGSGPATVKPGPHTANLNHSAINRGGEPTDGLQTGDRMPERFQGGTSVAARQTPGGLVAQSLPGLLVAAALLAVLLLNVHVSALQGVLNDPDSYMQIAYFRSLLANGGDHGGLFMRDNAPWGMALHWSRAYDLIVFALAAPLAALYGWQDAITRIGPVLGPIWAGVLIVSGVWAVRPVCTPWERAAVGFALAWTPILLVWGVFGNADHHLPVLIAWVILMGFALRIVLGGADIRDGVGAGLAGAAALWLNVDCIVPVCIGFAAIGLAWIRDGAPHRRASLAAAASFALALTAMLAFDPPAEGWREGFLDRLSLLYVVFSLLLAGLWLALAAAPQQPAAWRARLGVGVGGAALCGLVLALVFPQVLAPERSVFGALEGPTLWQAIAEMMPAFRSFDNGVLFMGGPIIGFAAALGFAWRARGTAALPGWLLFILVLGITGALGLYRTRFAIYPEALAALPIGMMLARIGPAVARRVPAASSNIWGGALGMLVVMSPVLGAATLRMPESGAAAAAPDCAVPAIAAPLNDPAFMGGRNQIIMSHPNYAPALLYWTGHRTVAGPYHRNVQGIADVGRFMASHDDRAARAIAVRRGLSYVLVCKGRAPDWPPRDGGRTLLERLEAGRVPAWLEPRPWPAGIVTDLRLYRIRPDSS